MNRSFKLALVCLCASVCVLAENQVQVQDHLMLGANNTPAQGTISVTNQAFQEQDGTQVAASTISVAVGSDGSFGITLYPTTAATYSSGATGAVFYSAQFYTASGGSMTQKWYVAEPGTSGITFPLTLQEMLKPSPLQIPVLSAVPSTCNVGATISVNGAEYLCTATNVYTQVPLNYQQLSGTPNVLLQSELGQANGVASLDGTTKVPVAQLPNIPYGNISNPPDLSRYLTQSQVGAGSGVAGLDGNAQVPLAQVPPIPFANITGVPSYLPAASVGQPNGVASLDGGGKVPTTQIPAIPYSGISGIPTLSPVATNGGDYSSLINKPTLGTASTHAATDFLAASGLGVANGEASLDTNGKVPTAQLPQLPLSQILGLGSIATANSGDYLAASSLNAPNGTAELDANRLLLASELPPITATQVTGLPTTLPPSGTAGGDLVGTYPNPTVKGINGTTLSSLGAGLLKQNGSGIPAIAINADVVQAFGYTPADVAKNGSDFTNPAAVRANIGEGSISTHAATDFLPDTGTNGLVKRTGAGTDAVAGPTDVAGALGYTPANAGLVGAANGIASLGANTQVPIAQIPPIPFADVTGVPAYVPLASVGVANGVAGLDNTGKVPSAQIPTQPFATTSLPGEVIVGNTLQISTGGNGNPAAGTLDVKSGQYDAAGAAAQAQTNSLQVVNNLSDVPNKTTALANLGVQSAALHPATDFVASSAVGVANGVAPLDNTIKVPIGDIPNIPLALIPGLGTIATHAAGDYLASTMRGAVNGVASLDANSLVPIGQIPNLPATQITGLGTAATQPSTAFVASTAVGAANGVASLDAATKVPVGQIPALPYSILSNPPALKPVATSGLYSDLTGAPAALPPNGPAAGDLAGNFPNPTVTGLNGTKLSTLGAGLLSQNAQGIPAIAASSAVTQSLGFTPMNPANNLGDVGNISTARGVLGLGTAATHAATDFLADSGTNGLVKRTGAGTTGTAMSSDVIGAIGYTPLNPNQIGAASGIASLDAGGKVPIGQIPAIPYADVTGMPSYILSSSIGAASGVAPLDGSGHVPSVDLPAQPIATGTTLGEVMIGSGFLAGDASSGKLSVDGTLYDAAGAAAAVATASIPTSAKGAANGVATLDNSTHVPIAQIPVIPYTNVSGAPSNLPPSGPATGDLGSSFPSPTVVGINGQNLKALGAGVLAQSANGIPRLANTGDMTGLLGFTPVNAANIGVANGIASLDATAKVPLTQIPTIPYASISGTPVIPPQYVLPIGSSTVLGGFMNGAGLNASGAGLLSVNFGTAAGTVMEGNDARVTGALPSSLLGQPSGIAMLNSSGLVPTSELGPAQSVTNGAVLTALGFTPISNALLNAASGVAGLDTTTHVPLAEIPTIPYTQLSGAPALGTIATHAATDYVANTNAGVTAALGFAPVNATTEGIANGIATLDATDHLTAAQLPTAIPYANLTGAPTGLPPTGAATGDLGGTYPAPTVAGINGQNMKALGAGLLAQNGNGVPGIANAASVTGSLGYTPVNTANVGVANGVAGLDATDKVPLAQIPTIPYADLSGTPVIPPQYVLPITSPTVLGGLMVGAGLTADATGLTSVQFGTAAGTAAQGNDTRITGAVQGSRIGQPSGVAELDANGLVPNSELGPAQATTYTAVTAALGYLPVNPNVVGANSGIAELDTTGHVPLGEIPIIPITQISGLPTFGNIVTHNVAEFVLNSNAAVVTALGYTPLNIGTRGSANGVAELDGNSLVPIAEIPPIPYVQVTGAPVGLPPTGPASGDLGGTYPAPKVVALNGTNLAGLGSGLLQQNASGIPSIANAASLTGLLGYTPINSALLGATNGVAILDGTTHVPLGEIPIIPYADLSGTPVIPPQYVLPVSTNTVLGGVQIGTGVSANASGVLSVNYGTGQGTAAQGNDSRIVNAVQLSAEGAPGGIATLDGSAHVPVGQLPTNAIVTSANIDAALGYTPVNPSLIGAGGGIASLDATNHVPLAQLPAIPSTDITGLPVFGNIVTHNAADFVSNNQTGVISALGFTPVNNSSVGSASGIAILDGNKLIPLSEIPQSAIVNNANVISAIGFTPANASTIGAPSGIASLDSTGKLLVAEMPAVVNATELQGNLLKPGVPTQAGEAYVWNATNSDFEIGPAAATLLPGPGILTVNGAGSSTVSIDPTYTETVSNAQTAIQIYCPSSGGNVSNYSCSTNPAVTTLTTPMLILWKPDVNGAGGSTTLNISGLGAKTLVEANGNAPTSTDILAGGIYPVAFDGTNLRIIGGSSFQMPAGSPGAAVVLGGLGMLAGSGVIINPGTNDVSIASRDGDALTIGPVGGAVSYTFYGNPSTTAANDDLSFYATVTGGSTSAPFSINPVGSEAGLLANGRVCFGIDPLYTGSKKSTCIESSPVPDGSGYFKAGTVDFTSGYVVGQTNNTAQTNPVSVDFTYGSLDLGYNDQLCWSTVNNFANNPAKDICLIDNGAANIALSSGNTDSTSFNLYNSTSGAHNWKIAVGGSANEPGTFRLSDTTANLTPVNFDDYGIYGYALEKIGWTSDIQYAAPTNLDTWMTRANVGEIAVQSATGPNKLGGLDANYINTNTITIHTGGSPPSCGSGNDGMLWNQAVSGSADKVIICRNNGTGSYSWVTAF